ncbi:GGDEF domain-containing protein [Clostridium sp. cel8]|uniref:diguanylate cyclase domain-containing protein n=1 Tax=Clostridium sp. cel8 TaxID=2663123 RepID=UPI0015F681A2|nr:GGDEF domain-containing protein [Clostridium sp. cel8]
MNYDDIDKKTLIKILRRKDALIKKLKYYASTDFMTEVLNRRSGLKLLDKKLNLSKINNGSIVVCFVDVDGLKRINDNFGHQEGDKLLINTAEVLKNNIRKTDFLVRMGGDEFLVVFPDTKVEEVHKIWNRIYVKLDEINKNNNRYNFSLSYGLCEYKKHIQGDMTINELIKIADNDMYKRKLQKKKELYDEKDIHI